VRKIVVIGATGTIGKAVADMLSLAQNCTIIRVGNRYGDYNIDLRSKASIETLFKNIGAVDGVVCAAGGTRFGNVLEARDNDFIVSLNNKLLGQINLVRVALRYLTPKGFITLTSGLMGRFPFSGTAPTAIANAAVEAFVRAAALDVTKGIRINAVSPIFIDITAKKMGLPTTGTMTAADTARAYQASIMGDMNGQIIDARKYGNVIDGGSLDWWNAQNVA